MRSWFHVWILAALLAGGLTAQSYGLNYMYFSEAEITRINHAVCVWHGDTLDGPVRSNSGLSIIQDPVFMDWYITGADTFVDCEGMAPHPQVFGPPPVFQAPPLTLPAQATWLRAEALRQGLFFAPGNDRRARAVLEGSTLRLWWLQVGTPADTVGYGEYTLLDGAAVFFDCPQLDLSGTVDATLMIGASGIIGLADNLLYATSDPLTGAPAANHAEKLAVVAEGDIKVLNTWANGRENSHGRGQIQTNPDSTSIALNGIYVALNESFTFEQQNDPDSGYVCPCSPDDRGTVYLYGSLWQQRRGHMHRSTRSSTGYLKHYRYDEALRFWDLHIFDARENAALPEQLAFGVVNAGEAAVDTLTLLNEILPCRPESLRVAAPFTVLAGPADSFAWSHEVVVQFQPIAAGDYADTLYWYEAQYGRWYGVPLSGQAAIWVSTEPLPAPLPATFTLAASPNPFNAQTRIAFTLPVAGPVSVCIYDVTGREIATLVNRTLTAGNHETAWDAAQTPTGVYFVRLSADTDTRTTKLLLLK